MLRKLSLLVLALSLAGCGSNASEPVAATPAAAPAAATPAEPAAAATAPIKIDSLTGKVLERLDASPYVYLRLQTATGEVWAAVPAADVQVGADVTVYSEMTMANFASKTLQRTFDELHFGTLTAPGAANSGGNPHAGAPASAAVDVGKVDKAAGADARTVAEAWAEAETLGGKSVTIRGKVVKFNGGIMGKNWLHLQDGSGDAAKGSNDITVTSQDEAAVGDTVTITGTVATHKDFGAGYSYAIIVEEAKVTKN